jgi:deazaflavin-dependent oxidoreductase (nitroreductase family)
MSVMLDTTKQSGPSAVRTMMRVIGTLHRLLYRCSSGRIGGILRGGPVLLLTTTGRRTGQERTWPLCYLSAPGDELVLVASAGGAPRHPAWYLNLRADLRVSIRLGEKSRKMVARIAEESERARLWELIVRRYPVVANYQRKSGREIPVVILRAATRQNVEGRSRRRDHALHRTAHPHRWRNNLRASESAETADQLERKRGSPPPAPPCGRCRSARPGGMLLPRALRGGCGGFRRRAPAVDGPRVARGGSGPRGIARPIHTRKRRAA